MMGLRILIWFMKCTFELMKDKPVIRARLLKVDRAKILKFIMNS